MYRYMYQLDGLVPSSKSLCNLCISVLQRNGGLALGKLLHDCPDLVAKNQELTRLVGDSGGSKP